MWCLYYCTDYRFTTGACMKYEVAKVCTHVKDNAYNVAINTYDLEHSGEQ